MAAGTWKFRKRAKYNLGLGKFDLSGSIFNITLHSAGASGNLTAGADISAFTSVGSQCTGGGYPAGGQTLSSPQWTLSGNNVKFDASDWTVTGSIADIKYAVIMQSVNATSGIVLCHSTLSATAFPLTTGNTLTIQMNASGIFTLA